MTKPKKVVKMKVTGTLYMMPQSFLLNLSEGHYAKLAVSLQLAPGAERRRLGSGGSSSCTESAGTLPEEPLVREIVTNAVTGQSGTTLSPSTGRVHQAADPYDNPERDRSKGRSRALSGTNRAIGEL